MIHVFKYFRDGFSVRDYPFEIEIKELKIGEFDQSNNP